MKRITKLITIILMLSLVLVPCQLPVYADSADGAVEISKENFPDLPQRRQTAQPVFAQKQFSSRVQSSSNPNSVLNHGSTYRNTTTLTQFPGFDIAMGMQDPISLEVVR